MKISTTRFGEIEVEQEHIFCFPQGIPGFEHIHEYLFIQNPEDLPFCYMQSVTQADLAFIVTDPFVFYPDYDFEIPEESVGELELSEPRDVKVWSIVTVQGKLENATINLSAPVVLNMNTNKGKQIILNHSPYKTRHPLLVEAAAEFE